MMTFFVGITAQKFFSRDISAKNLGQDPTPEPIWSTNRMDVIASVVKVYFKR
jgi:hypothetical protein